jgi:hypothetical protein
MRSGFLADFFVLRPEGVFTYVEWEQTGEDAKIQNLIIRSGFLAEFFV